MTLLLAATLLLLLQAPQSAAPSVAGAWEGSSLCTVPNSPCHDEHVVYHIKPDAKESARFLIDADKVIDGKEEFMGTIECIFTAEKSELYCDTAGDWRFTVKEGTMTGTLNLKNGTLYRKVSVMRKE
jgi:hypothetical protein